jgi:hypothetical protein
VARPTGHRDAALWCFPLLSIAFDLPPQSLVFQIWNLCQEQAEKRLLCDSNGWVSPWRPWEVPQLEVPSQQQDWETGRLGTCRLALNLNGDSQRFRVRLDSTCGENWQVPSFSWFAGPTVFEVCSSLCSLMFTVLFCEIHGVPLEFQGHVIACHP